MTAGLTWSDLRSPFQPPPDARDQIGMEVECATLERGTGRAAMYGGGRGTERLLGMILADLGGEPIRGPSGLIGLRLEDGAKITLEASGALEYSSRPAPDLVTLDEEARRLLQVCATHAAKLGLALVPGGNIPFNTLSNVEWVPDAHVDIMRRFCERLGEPGTASLEVSTLAVTTQTTLDQGSASELTERVRVAFSAAAVVSALFVNSPLYNGQPSGQLSWRMSRLRREDPSRFGFPPFATRDDISPDHFIHWLLGLPMIHRSKNGHEQAASDRSFGQLLIEGFEDGSRPTLADWQAQIGQAWPFVRLRKTIEVRLPDGPPYSHIISGPAFWVGLLYHQPSLDAAWELVKGRTVSDHLRTIEDVALSGLDARYGDQPVGELAAELLRLAMQGIQARVTAGLERPEALRYLEPLHEVVVSGETFAHRQLRCWETDLADSPERLVAAYQI